MNTELANNELLLALKGKRAQRTPVWLMRQAGRYLPEYRALRAKHGFMEMLKSPEVAKEITLQPLRRFPLSAAILFADILTPLVSLGLQVEFVEGEGPVIRNPIVEGRDVKRLALKPASESVPFTLQTVEDLVRELTPLGTPLLGFSGAPFTLAYYACGERDRAAKAVKTFMRKEPEAWVELSTLLEEMVGEYLVAQGKAGASAVQLFDSWVGALSPAAFRASVLPGIQRIVKRVRKEVGIPVIYYAGGASGMLDAVNDVGADCYSLDWKTSLARAARALPSGICFQGNLDPSVLFAPHETICREAAQVLEEAKEVPAHIFNLGHGIIPGTPLEGVECLINFIRGERGR